MASFLVFIVFTILYLVARGLFDNTWENKINKQSSVYGLLSMCYVIFLIVWQCKTNIAETTGHCGSPQWSNIIIWTIIPNIVFFGSIFLIFKYFPGWKAPFANTFGYAYVSLISINGKKLKFLLNKILKGGPENKKVKDQHGGGVNSNSNGGDQSDKCAPSVKELLTLMYEDPSILINKISPNNWDEWFEKTQIKEIFKPQYIENIDNNKATPDIKDLYKFVVQRDLMAEFWWLFLIGIFISGLQTNSLANLVCKTSGPIASLKSSSHIADKDDDVQKGTKKIYYTTE